MDKKPISRGTHALAFLFAIVFSIIPLTLISYPPLLDYPAHLARAYILNNWSNSTSLQDWYTIQSFVLPNMGMDICLLLLAKFFPIELAGRIFAALNMGLILGGCVFVNKSLFGRLSLWPLVSSFFLYNGILLLGFMNYLFGVSLMLWATGFWIYLSRSSFWIRFIAGTFAATVLFFSHLVAVGLFALIVAGYELQKTSKSFAFSRQGALMNLAVGASIFFVPLMLFLISATAGEAASDIVYIQPYYLKFLISLWTLLSGNLFTDILAAIVIVLIFAGIFAGGTIQFASPMILPIGFLLVSFLVLPHAALSSWYLDTRIFIALVFVAVSCTRVEFHSTAWHRTVLLGAAVLLIFRSISVTYDWRQHEQTYHEITNAFSTLPNRSILFVVSERPHEQVVKNLGADLPIWHLGALATIERDIFVPAIFSHPSQQPITVNNRFETVKAFQKQDPIFVKDSEMFRNIVEDIRNIIDRAALNSFPAYLLVLDPQVNLDNGGIVASGSRFYVLKL